MLNYFYENRTIPEVSTICTQLDILKTRISSGDYENSRKEYDVCKELFNVIKAKTPVPLRPIGVQSSQVS